MEEAMSLRYMLRCSGDNIPVDMSCLTKVINDNFSVVQHSQNPTADLSKKHVAISYHIVRDAVTDGIIEPHWINGGYNIADILIEQIKSSSRAQEIRMTTSMTSPFFRTIRILKQISHQIILSCHH